MKDQIRILCVDDERNVLRALERIFLDYDYEILIASSGEEGLELLRGAEQVQVVISDYRMPGLNGVEFLKEVCKSHPETIRIVLSGYADTAAVVSAINEGQIYKFIPKPWNDDELRLTVANALETFDVRRRNVQLAEELHQKNEELRELNANLEQLVAERTSELRLQNRALLHARNVLKNLPVGVIGLGTDGVVQQVNREAAALLGIEGPEAVGRSAREAFPELFGTPLPVISGDSCSYQTVRIKGAELQVKGITVIEDGEAGIVLTLTRGAVRS